MGKDEPKWEKNAHEGHVEKETNVRDGHVPHFLLLSFFFFIFLFFLSHTADNKDGDSRLLTNNSLRIKPVLHVSHQSPPILILS